MALGPYCRFLLILAGVFLMVFGADDFRGALSSDLRRVAPLTDRIHLQSQGTLKFGLGMGFAALAAAGTGVKKSVRDER